MLWFGQRASTAQSPPFNLDQEIRIWSDRSLSGRKLWSFANYSATILIIIFSTLAAALSQTHAQLAHHWWAFMHVKNDQWVALLACLVTIITAVQSKVGFERKWVANRLTNSSLEQLNIDAYSSNLSPSDKRDRFKAIVEAHNKSIIG